ncbi:alpha/beta hydrolase family protein [Bryobacter aggregatus]|uniref:alpha/beta hydrolase family protein n=1 Tax=Bryobacter aggregatus TaxID=360054 RepID=UPI0004E1B7B4|nr:alpha/beta fold hydrolase [Bryobacter aggregatus]
MKLLILLLAVSGLFGQSVAGTYLGQLDAGFAGKLRLGLELRQSSEGKLSGEIVSIDQGYANIPAASVQVEGKLLKISLPVIGASYEGSFSEDGKTITGTFTQGAALELVLKRVAELPRPARPQEPKPPFVYEVEEVSFTGGAPDVTLAATLTKPKGAGRFAAVVLVSGSGPQNRDEELAGHKPFWIWADALTRAGFTVLRYDDRGTAKSTGKFKGSTSNDFALDAAGAVTYLRTRKDIDATKIVVMGHSEGGLIAPIVAAADPKLAGIVLLAGTGVTGEKVLRRQLPDLARAAGLNEEMAQENAKKTLEKMQANLSSDLWLKHFWAYDPAPTLQKVKCPVLALNGSLDKQVNADENLTAIGAALREGGNKNVTIETLPKLNHLFQTAQTGSGQEYGKIEETLSPVAIETVQTWLKKTLSTK